MTTINETGALKPRQGGAIEGRLRAQLAAEITQLVSTAYNDHALSISTARLTKLAERVAQGVIK